MKGRQTLGKCPQTPGLEGESGEEHSPAILPKSDVNPSEQLKKTVLSPKPSFCPFDATAQGQEASEWRC